MTRSQKTPQKRHWQKPEPYLLRSLPLPKQPWAINFVKCPKHEFLDPKHIAIVSELDKKEKIC